MSIEPFKRLLNEDEELKYDILAKQIAANRPALIICPLAEMFVRLWYAYEIKSQQLKGVEERR